jgi:hypothetical protein
MDYCEMHAHARQTVVFPLSKDCSLPEFPVPQEQPFLSDIFPFRRVLPCSHHAPSIHIYIRPGDASRMIISRLIQLKDIPT